MEIINIVGQNTLPSVIYPALILMRKTDDGTAGGSPGCVDAGLIYVDFTAAGTDPVVTEVVNNYAFYAGQHIRSSTGVCYQIQGINSFDSATTPPTVFTSNTGDPLNDVIPSCFDCSDVLAPGTIQVTFRDVYNERKPDTVERNREGTTTVVVTKDSEVTIDGVVYEKFVYIPDTFPNWAPELDDGVRGTNNDSEWSEINSPQKFTLEFFMPKDAGDLPDLYTLSKAITIDDFTGVAPAYSGRTKVWTPMEETVNSPWDVPYNFNDSYFFSGHIRNRVSNILGHITAYYNAMFTGVVDPQPRSAFYRYNRGTTSTLPQTVEDWIWTGVKDDWYDPAPTPRTAPFSGGGEWCLKIRFKHGTLYGGVAGYLPTQPEDDEDNITWTNV